MVKALLIACSLSGVLVGAALLHRHNSRTNDEIPVFVSRTAAAPELAHERGGSVPTNNWVTDGRLTSEEAIHHAIDIEELKVLARYGIERGERAEKIVLSDTNFAWITYSSGETQIPRLKGVWKVEGNWR